MTEISWGVELMPKLPYKECMLRIVMNNLGYNQHKPYPNRPHPKVSPTDCEGHSDSREKPHRISCVCIKHAYSLSQRGHKTQ